MMSWFTFEHCCGLLAGLACVAVIAADLARGYFPDQ